MSEHDLIYRPPAEANSLLIHTASGCTYAKCTFCNESLQSAAFRAEKTEDILAEIHRLAQQPENRAKKVAFLLGSNVLSASTSRLQAILYELRTYLPNITGVHMYARAEDVLHKGVEELSALKAAGLEELYIGIESGCDAVLELCRKGVTAREQLAALQKLDGLGIAYSLSSILGLGGQALWRQHAVETGEFYARTKPRTIRIMTLTPWPGTELFNQIQAGTFQMLTPLEVLREELVFIRHLEGCDTLLIAAHQSNTRPLAGRLPEDRAFLMQELEDAIISSDPETLRPHVFSHM